MQSDREITDSAVIICPHIQTDCSVAFIQLHPQFYNDDKWRGEMLSLESPLEFVTEAKNMTVIWLLNHLCKLFRASTSGGGPVMGRGSFGTDTNKSI